MIRRALAMLAAAAALAAPAARAQEAEPASPGEAPRFGSVTVRGQTYVPDVDAEFGGAKTPYATIFGDRTRWMFRAELARALYHGVGTVEVGLGAGYFTASGHGQIQGTTTSSIDKTSLDVVPVSLFAQYRFDWLAERFNVPLAPYGKLALERYNWWTGGTNKPTKYGATNGWSATGGVAILLDFFDPTLAREMDRDTGVHHTYLDVDVSKATVDDFGSKSSWNLSDKKVSFGVGMTFVF